MINSLRQLLCAPLEQRAASQIIAFDRASRLSWGHFCSRIAAWEQLLAPLDAPIIALYERDAVEFAAALLALWRLGRQALLPANNLAISCQQLAEITPWFAGDFPSVGALKPAANPAADYRLAPLPAPDVQASALILFTSGSSSAPVPVHKSFAQLEAELAALECQWGSRLAGAHIAATVSHQHIYGLLFRLLWPLCAGRPFAIRERDYWEEIARDAECYQPLVVVSSPAHLSRIPPLSWPDAAPLAALFSSGAPLTTAAALAAKAQLGQSVTEVYGSTETGGIGWREQDQQHSWTPLPGVAVRLDDSAALLQVRSPHLPDDHWFSSSDQAALDEQGNFNLCGRADRIAKVGGKRISLSAIEQLLLQQPGVAQVQVLQLPERGERLGAVIVLDNDGNKQLVDQGKNLINQQLKSALENQVDRIAIPRYWRYLGELPQNRQGKTTLAELQALFGSAPLPRLPELIAQHWQQEALLLELFIPANLYYFDGHFPGRPVLPGVVQTHWAVHYGREYFGALGDFSALEAIKFQQIITANQRLLLRLEYQADKGKLYFSYTSHKGDSELAHASGRIAFVPAAVPQAATSHSDAERKETADV